MASEYDIAYVRDFHSDDMGQFTPPSVEGRCQASDTKAQLDAALGERSLALVHSPIAVRSRETAMLLAGEYPNLTTVSSLPIGKRTIDRLSKITDREEWAESRAQLEADAVEQYLHLLDVLQARHTNILRVFIMSGRAIASSLDIKLRWGDDSALHVPFDQMPLFGEPVLPSGEVLIPNGAVMHEQIEPRKKLIGGTNFIELVQFDARQKQSER